MDPLDPNGAEQAFRNFQQMAVNDEDVNILLLGETGVGKSTFINSFANYLERDKFSVAEQNNVRCLIPAKFTVTNEDFEEKLVQIGSDSNENNTIYKSATQETRSYVFPISKQGTGRIRLIDTPGIGDVGGIDRDNENMENILSYISYLENLHAICFLLKPNNTRLTVMFHYCIKQLLSRLEKSASKNIIFVFTNTRSSFYKPGDTTTALKKVLEDIKSSPPYTEINFSKDNVFCLDNESFRYLVAIKNNISLGNKQSFVESWTHSVQECWRMINFITGKGDSKIKVKPHKVRDTLSVNEARKVILQLSKPIADIADLINDNIKALEKHNKSLRTDNQSIFELKKNLYVPVINLRCKELSQPTTVCTAHKCCEVIMVANTKKYHYKQRCHDPCYLQNVPKELIGSPELVNCYAMTNRVCRECKCDFSVHMHIYYISETFEDKIDNEGVKAQIKDRETALKETQKLLNQIESRRKMYEDEKDVIIKTMAKFAHFLQSNAIAPYNDSYKSYIEYLIDREKSAGVNCDLEMIKYYNELLKRYAEEKKILDQALSSGANPNSTLTATVIFKSVESLYKLPHTGSAIKELHLKQSQSQRTEHKNTEIVLDVAGQKLLQTKEGNAKKRNRGKNKNQGHNPNERGKTGLNQNDYPHMKAKDRRQDNNSNRGRNKNYNANYNRANDIYRPNIPNLMSINPGNINSQNGQHRYGHMQNPNPFGVRGPHPQHMNYQGPYFPGSYMNPNYPPGPQHHQGPPQHMFSAMQQGSPQHMFQGVPLHQQQPFYNYQHNQGNYQQSQMYHPDRSRTEGRPSYGGQQNFSPNSSNFNEDIANNKKPLNRNSNDTSDENFEKWFQSISGDHSQESSFKHIDNLSNKHVYREDSSDSSDTNESAESNDQTDDEEFKEFMTKNNLEYLVKPGTKNSSVNENKNNKKSRKRNDKDYSCKESQPYRDDNDFDDYGKNDKSKGNGSGFFRDFIDKILH